MFDYMIVGAGFAGSVLAERLASVANKKVLIGRTSEITSAEMRMTIIIIMAYWSISMDRIFSIRTAKRCSII